MLLERLVQFGRTAQYDHLASFDPEIIGPAALLNLGACQARRGALDQPEACYQALLDDSRFRGRAFQGISTVAALRAAR
jgi:hypothetical protein